MNELEKPKLSTLADGAAEEMFRLALETLLSNVDDPSTPWKAKRRITLTIDLVVDESRRDGKLYVACKTTSPESRPAVAQVVLGHHQGVLTAANHPQFNMFNDPQAGPRPLAATGGNTTP